MKPMRFMVMESLVRLNASGAADRHVVDAEPQPRVGQLGRAADLFGTRRDRSRLRREPRGALLGNGESFGEAKRRRARSCASGATRAEESGYIAHAGASGTARDKTKSINPPHQTLRQNDGRHGPPRCNAEDLVTQAAVEDGEGRRFGARRRDAVQTVGDQRQRPYRPHLKYRKVGRLGNVDFGNACGGVSGRTILLLGVTRSRRRTAERLHGSAR